MGREPRQFHRLPGRRVRPWPGKVIGTRQQLSGLFAGDDGSREPEVKRIVAEIVRDKDKAWLRISDVCHATRQYQQRGGE
jgi:hypothetical protein